MNKIVLIFFLLLVAISVYSENSKKRKQVEARIPVCYISKEVHRSYVGPSYDFRLKSASQKNADIIVIYDDEFEDDSDAKAAFEAATEIWEGLISSPVPIYVYAYWDDLDENVLGSCGPWNIYSNLDFLPKKDTYYPGPIVEKMFGEEITDGSSPDIYARFNKSFSWYFGTDGNTPTNKVDFLSVVLHELGHGLGYVGMADVDTDNGTGEFSYSEYYPGIFDCYITNSNSEYLADTSLFANPSAELLAQFQSGFLEFKGQIPYDDYGNSEYPRLYAPLEFDDGSSIYHLNESTYSVGDANSLMTPSVSYSEAIHDPGPLSLGMLYEMGWKFIRIKHDQVPDIEDLADLKKVEAYIESDYDLDTTSLYLISSYDNFVTADSTLLSATETSTKFEADLPITEEGTIKYYLSAGNKRNQKFTMPGIAPEKYYSVTFGEDNTIPTLSHDPISYMKADSLSAEIVVQAEDNLGVDWVKVTYIANENDPQELLLTLDSDEENTYKGTMTFSEGSLLDGDSVRYRIEVQDKSVKQNQNFLPSEDEYYKFYIEGTYDPVKNYYTDFNTTNRDFISADFSITTPINFENGALHSLHPYESPEKEDATYEYTAQLKYPIIIKDGGIITYDEVVLVEPGESGAEYGSDSFYDYVIVEGSKDNGKNWLPLIDGYDSGDNSSWKTAYNNGISGNNSLTVGTSDMYVNREFYINEKGNFEIGDTILIQFRLYSDPYANGWGWCIDNLNIQDPVSSSLTLEYSPGELLFYPNPVEDNLIFQGSFSKETGTVTLLVFNNVGQAVIKKELDVNGTSIYECINMNNLRSGLYYVSVEFQNGQKISRKIVKK